MKYISIFFLLVTAVLASYTAYLSHVTGPVILKNSTKVFISNDVFFFSEVSPKALKKYEIVLNLDRLDKDPVPSCWVGDNLYQGNCNFFKERLDMTWQLKDGQNIIQSGNRDSVYGPSSWSKNQIGFVIGSFKVEKSKDYKLYIKNNQDFQKINIYHPQISVELNSQEAKDNAIRGAIIILVAIITGIVGILFGSIYLFINYRKKKIKQHPG